MNTIPQTTSRQVNILSGVDFDKHEVDWHVFINPSGQKITEAQLERVKRSVIRVIESLKIDEQTQEVYSTLDSGMSTPPSSTAQE